MGFFLTQSYKIYQIVDIGHVKSRGSLFFMPSGHRVVLTQFLQVGKSVFSLFLSASYC